MKKKVAKVYTCGPTVYQYAHIGNMRAFVTADLLHRTLAHGGYRIEHVINITDVGHLATDIGEGEDKIEAQARRENRSAREVAAFYTKAFFADLSALNIARRGIRFPAASRHIREQIALIRRLEARGFTYRASDGIYFDTSKFPGYGSFARLRLGKLREGARVAANPEKQSPHDFALWKFSPAPGTRQQEWKSPWGVGFPGWHIECSAMSMKYLGERFDIHTGGVDHIPVHHTNEIAQSEAATGKRLANYWLHNEFVTMGGEKMAKSVGNILTLRDLAARGISPSAYRYWLLTAHYRSPVRFSLAAVSGAQKALDRLVETLAALPRRGRVLPVPTKTFTGHMENDINTPKAVAGLWEFIRDPNVSAADKRATILLWDEFLGIGLKKLLRDFQAVAAPRAPQTVIKLLRERDAARGQEDWKTADRLRTRIHELGYDIIDTPQGSQLRKR